MSHYSRKLHHFSRFAFSIPPFMLQKKPSQLYSLVDCVPFSLWNNLLCCSNVEVNIINMGICGSVVYSEMFSRFTSSSDIFLVAFVNSKSKDSTVIHRCRWTIFCDMDVESKNFDLHVEESCSVFQGPTIYFNSSYI